MMALLMMHLSMGGGMGIMEKQERRAVVLEKLKVQKIKFLTALETLESGGMNPAANTTTDKVKQILTRNAYFNMRHYLDCSMAICIAFGKRIERNWDLEVGLIYVLTHARAVRDPASNLFQFNELDKKTIIFKKPSLTGPHPDTIYMNKIKALITDLKYNQEDEMKYRILNINMTYLTLVILRACVQDEIQYFSSSQYNNTKSDYYNILGPYSINSELPRLNEYIFRRLNMDTLREPIILARHAFFTVKDDQSKMMLYKTCIQYFEWYNMDLPGLFFKVCSLYGIEKATLWDLFSSVKTFPSLYTLAEVLNENAMHEAFPYSRPIKSRSIDQLGGHIHGYICTILAYMVDIKIGFDKSFIRNSEWAFDSAKKPGMKIAKVFHAFYKNKRSY